VGCLTSFVCQGYWSIQRIQQLGEPVAQASLQGVLNRGFARVLGYERRVG